MKKYLSFTTLTLVFIITTSFSTLIVPAKLGKDNSGPAFACAVPDFISVTTSGGYTTFVRKDPSPQHVYKFGGYYSSGGGFSYCVTDNNSIEIPHNGGGTAQVRAICQGTCDNATESSNPTPTRTF